MKCSSIEQRNPMVILRTPYIIINYLRIKLIYKNSYVNTKYTHIHTNTRTISSKKMNEVNEVHEMNKTNETKEKGSRCSISGKKYELAVYNIVKKTRLNGIEFNTQIESELGGCSSKNDIECNMKKAMARDISVEIKKLKTPDWMQCCLKYDDTDKKWIGSKKNKIPEASKKVFEELITTVTLFNGKIPPFMLKDITHEEWVKVKSETTDFNDVYIECPSDTIMKLYSEKGCSYIQISDKGVYQLGNDVCDFKVHAFICDQQLRVRTKIHKKKNKKGFCKLSVTVACQPKNINNLVSSEFSLDNRMKLPSNLVYDEITCASSGATNAILK